jgi:hypothetical protein
MPISVGSSNRRMLRQRSDARASMAIADIAHHEGQREQKIPGRVASRASPNDNGARTLAVDNQPVMF